MPKQTRRFGGVKYVPLGRSMTKRAAEKRVAYIKKNITPRVRKVRVGKKYRVSMGVDF